MTSSPVTIDNNLFADLFALSSAHALAQAEAREIAAQFAARAHEVRQHFLDHSELHPELWTAFCQHGWPGMVLPAEYGGADGGLLGMALVLEALAQQNLVL